MLTDQELDQMIIGIHKQMKLVGLTPCKFDPNIKHKEFKFSRSDLKVLKEISAPGYVRVTYLSK